MQILAYGVAVVVLIPLQALLLTCANSSLSHQLCWWWLIG